MEGAGEDLLRALDKEGIMDVLMGVLKHESPFSVAAAAACLGWWGRKRGAGIAMIEASGAVPGLLCVIKRALPPEDSEDESDLFSRYLPDHSRAFVVAVQGGLFRHMCFGESASAHLARRGYAGAWLSASQQTCLYVPCPGRSSTSLHAGITS